MLSARNSYPAAIAFAALTLVACGELPQDGPKPFVSADEQRSTWHRPHEVRSSVQDDYSMIPGDNAVARAEPAAGT